MGRRYHQRWFVYAPSQWEMTLHSNVISHWLGAYTKMIPENGLSIENGWHRWSSLQQLLLPLVTTKLAWSWQLSVLSAETRIFLATSINTKATNVLVPCVTRPSVAGKKINWSCVSWERIFIHLHQLRNKASGISNSIVFIERPKTRDKLDKTWHKTLGIWLCSPLTLTFPLLIQPDGTKSLPGGRFKKA